MSCEIWCRICCEAWILFTHLFIFPSLFDWNMRRFSYLWWHNFLHMLQEKQIFKKAQFHFTASWLHSNGFFYLCFLPIWIFDGLYGWYFDLNMITFSNVTQVRDTIVCLLQIIQHMRRSDLSTFVWYFEINNLAKFLSQRPWCFFYCGIDITVECIIGLCPRNDRSFLLNWEKISKRLKMIV